MRLPHLRSLLLVLLLLSGQWLSFAHAQQDVGAPTHQGCEYCVHAQALLPGLASLPTTALAAVVHELPVRRPASVAARTAARHYDIRGPPRA